MSNELHKSLKLTLFGPSTFSCSLAESLKAEAAIFETLIDEVLVAKIVESGSSFARDLKIANLVARFSVAA